MDITDGKVDVFCDIEEESEEGEDE